MKRTASEESTTPGKVISPLDHAHRANESVAPSEKVDPLSQATPAVAKDSAAKKLAKPPKDKTEITIGPTTPTGPDISLGFGR